MDVEDAFLGRALVCKNLSIDRSKGGLVLFNYIKDCLIAVYDTIPSHLYGSSRFICGDNFQVFN